MLVSHSLRFAAQFEPMLDGVFRFNAIIVEVFTDLDITTSECKQNIHETKSTYLHRVYVPPVLPLVRCPLKPQIIIFGPDIFCTGL